MTMKPYAYEIAAERVLPEVFGSIYKYNFGTDRVFFNYSIQKQEFKKYLVNIESFTRPSDPEKETFNKVWQGVYVEKCNCLGPKHSSTCTEFKVTDNPVQAEIEGYGAFQKGNFFVFSHTGEFEYHFYKPSR